MAFILKWEHHNKDVLIIDSPQDRYFDAETGMIIRGWAIPEVKNIHFQFKAKQISIEKTVERTDVSHHFGEIGIDFENDFHGFHVELDIDSFECLVEFVDGSMQLALKASVVNEPDVLIGKLEWLFLNSDNNKNVALAQGLIDVKTPASKWDDYFSKVDKLTRSMNAKWVFALIPSKEIILSSLAPFGVSDKNFLIEFLELTLRKDDLICPIKTLKKYGIVSYSPGDTHVTDVGAAIIVQEILSKLEIENDLNPFAPVAFFPEIGDLGDKLLDTYSSITPHLEFQKKVRLVFDNYRRSGGNRGRLMVFESTEEYASGTIFVSGGSTFHRLQKFLTPWFKRTVFFHGTGLIDEGLIREVNPTHVLLLNGDRFMATYPGDQWIKLKDDLHLELIDLNENSGYRYYDEILSDLKSTTDND